MSAGDDIGHMERVYIALRGHLVDQYKANVVDSAAVSIICQALDPRGRLNAEVREIACPAPRRREPDRYAEAVAIVREHKKVSPSLVQRHLSSGYNEALEYIERMQSEGICTKANSAGRRELL